MRTEIEGHAEVGEARCGQDDYRNLVEESNASRSLYVGDEIAVSFELLWQETPTG